MAAEQLSFDTPQIGAQLTFMSDAERTKPMPAMLRMLEPACNERMYPLVT